RYSFGRPPVPAANRPAFSTKRASGNLSQWVSLSDSTVAAIARTRSLHAPLIPALIPLHRHAPRRPTINAPVKSTAGAILAGRVDFRRLSAPTPASIARNSPAPNSNLEGDRKELNPGTYR